ncbi:asparagine synthase (glutamine-hydrolyzing) [Stenotrophomonas maltophilia]|nr:asparagine synthase (glutamine-hydrolyzing) [Stenotrophomonas maltophilia]
MCGLAGMLLPAPVASAEVLQAQVLAMGEALHHRGPDDGGSWVDAGAGIALAHRRLSILDLSPLGHQPMASSDGRYVMAYNGEVYNFATLRAELEPLGHAFRGHSDTEVLLAAILQWGMEDTLQRCNGMFAIALWDRQEQCLWLARDRVGKKPLYYGWAGDTLVFGSELKALWQHPAFDAEAVAAGAAAHRPEQAQRPYWDARARMQAALAAPFQGRIEEAEEQLDGLLRDAVALRMVADVPVGVFLSGGTDSSLVAALMQAQSGQPVHSFSIGFTGSGHDEAPLAKELAAHLGCDHTELYVSGADALAVVPQLPAMFDEPFADASQVPTALVARLARQGVTVALSGDGGDELFFGYTRYVRALRNWQMLGRVPGPLRRWMGARSQQQGEASRTGGLAALLAESGARGIGDVYRNRISRWRDPAAAVPGAQAAGSFYDLADPLHGAGTPADAMMLADYVTYLPDDLLCKVDRTSMAVSLEARAPLLDSRVAEFAWSLPLGFKRSETTSKVLLKRVLGRYVPQSMVHRPKRGFGAPVSDWLKGDLRPWAEDLLQPARLEQEGVLSVAAVQPLWQQFLGGQRKWHTHLWNVLMFQAWQAHWRQVRAGVTGG